MVGNDQIVPSGIKGHVGGVGGCLSVVYGLNTACGLGGRCVVGFDRAVMKRRGRRGRGGVAVQGKGQRGRAIDNKDCGIGSVC